MIFLIIGRIGSGMQAYAEAMKSAGFTCVQNELAALDGKPVANNGTPRYAVTDPNGLKEILAAFPKELFHVIQICVDDDTDDDEKEASRLDRYIAESGKPADEAEKIFAEQDAKESSMFDEFESGFDTLADKFENFRAKHTITNNFDPTTGHDWADYFYKYHTMYNRILRMTHLGVMHNVVNHNEQNDIMLVYRPDPNNHNKPGRIECVSQEIFADILLSDDEGLARLIRSVFETATADEIAALA